MPSNELCPRCGTRLPDEADPGGCPRCLLQAGLDEPTAAGAGASVDESPSTASLAARFPELEIVGLVGHGGMGFVYEARQLKLERRVALKILAPRFAESPEFAERFTREARALARLSHPNIVAVHDFGERDGLYFFSMEFVDGANLRDVIRSGKLEPSEALAIVPHICDALQYAHEQGVVHRDIKPENVLVDREGRVKLTDFGLAKLARASRDDLTLTAAGTVMGTPQYMAPEQLERPHTVDHRADIYSLGVVFYELLTGELPIGRFAPPSRKVAVDVSLDEVVLKALEKEPERRYQHAVDVKTGVDDYVVRRRTSEPSLGAPSPASSAEKAPRRSRLAVWGVGLEAAAALAWLIMVALAALLFTTSSSSGAADRTWSVSIVGLLIPGVVSALATAATLVGMGLSIAAWIVIARSDGRLSGLRLAVVGTFAPVAMYVAAQLIVALMFTTWWRGV